MKYTRIEIKDQFLCGKYRYEYSDTLFKCAIQKQHWFKGPATWAYEITVIGVKTILPYHENVVKAKTLGEAKEIGERLISILHKANSGSHLHLVKGVMLGFTHEHEMEHLKKTGSIMNGK